MVKKASKIWSALPAGNPTPVSLTEISTWPPSLLSRLDREDSASLLHRLNTIEHEVHQYLLQLHPVRRDLGKIGGKIRTNRNGVPVGFSPQQQDHFADDVI